VASKSLVEWLKMSWENWRMSTGCVACYCLPVCLFSPPRLEGSLPFYRSRGWRITMRAALSSYVGRCDVLCCRVGGRLDDPCGDLAIMVYLVPEQWRFEGRRAADGGDVL
jgi:hypothetical protein